MIAGTRACLSVATTLCNGDGVAAVLVVEIIKLGEVAGAHVRARPSRLSGTCRRQC